MSIKFRRRIRLLPGFTINLSKTGLSATVGVRGASLNVGPKGEYLNLGIPGTGIYDRTRLDKRPTSAPIEPRPQDVIPSPMPAPAAIETPVREIKSFNPELLTSKSLFGLKDTILNAQHTKEEMRIECIQARKAKKMALVWVIISHALIFGIFIKNIRSAYREKVKESESANQDFLQYKLDVSFNFDREALNDYITLQKAFYTLSQSQRIWDITTEKDTNKVKERTIASKALTRKQVTFSTMEHPLIHTEQTPFLVRNANGADIYVYPQFILVSEQGQKDFGILDLRDIKVAHRISRFIESEPVPSDSIVVGNTWKYANKDGSPDKRFNGNFQIPIVEYGEIELTSDTGLNECYQFSNTVATATFYQALEDWRRLLTRMNWTVSRQDEADLVQPADGVQS